MAVSLGTTRGCADRIGGGNKSFSDVPGGIRHAANQPGGTGPRFGLSWNVEDMDRTVKGCKLLRAGCATEQL